MSADLALHPGLGHAARGSAAREDRAPDASRSLESWLLSALAAPARAAALHTLARQRARQLRQAAQAVRDRLATAQPGPLPAGLAARVRREGFAGPAGQALLAHVAACARAHTGQRPWTTQLMAALALLDGHLAEMATGEGKTYAIALAAAAAALTGRRVHVMTANDYLVERDADRARPWMQALGLRCGAVLSRHDSASRAQAWQCEVTYCVAREAAFDHMRDAREGRHGGGALERCAAGLRAPAAGQGGPPLLPALDLALIDEADSQLIDDATLPLLLAAPPSDDRQAAARRRAHVFQTLSMARRLERGTDFELGGDTAELRWTVGGLARLDAMQPGGDPAWGNRRHRRDQVELALRALHALQRDRDYVVREGKVEIVDASTGRSAAGRSWSRGLHQMVEAKEGCPLTEPTRVAARLSLQRFFGRYLGLAGVSGTALETRQELHRAFGLVVVPIPLRRPGRRMVGPLRLFADAAQRHAAVPARVMPLLAAGRAVLVTTDTVEQARALCTELARHGLEPARLDALHDAQEAAVVAAAGQPGALTVATRMAGRGTDIELHPDTRAAGGLHVIVCQDNPSQRLDRQAMGRSARAGDPGSAEIWRTLDATAWQPRPGPTAVIDHTARWLCRRATAGTGPHLRLHGLAAAWFKARQRQHEHAGWRLRQLQLEEDLQWQTRVGWPTAAR